MLYNYRTRVEDSSKGNTQVSAQGKSVPPGTRVQREEGGSTVILGRGGALILDSGTGCQRRFPAERTLDPQNRRSLAEMAFLEEDQKG